MRREAEDLPEGTRFTDVLEAAQAAWMAGQYALARDLIQRYIDPVGEFCCMRCTKMCEDEPWAINNHLGKFRVCPDCATVVSTPRELLAGGGEVFMQGPVQKIGKTYRSGRIMTTVETRSSQTTLTINGEKDGKPHGFLIAAIAHAIGQKP